MATVFAWETRMKIFVLKNSRHASLGQQHAMMIFSNFMQATNQNVKLPTNDVNVQFVKMDFTDPNVKNVRILWCQS